MSKFKLVLGASLGVALILSTTACSPQAGHPNQINTFDGASYDSLTLAHGALSSLRASIITNSLPCVPLFNETAAAYGTAYSAYALYRATPGNQASVAVAVSNLAVSIVALESDFQSQMHVPAATVLKAHSKAARIRSAHPEITISDILSELEIAASIAETVPGTQPYSTLAALVIDATQQALSASKSASGQPIDLSTIQPVAAIQ